MTWFLSTSVVPALLIVLLWVPVTMPANDANDSVLFVRTQSLYPPYIDFEMSNRWFDFGGSTLVSPNRYIRLTPTLPGRKGWLRSKSALYADSWSIEFEYKIHGKPTHAGDGFAFWHTRDRIQTQGNLLGGPDKWSGLVIAFDTYDNGRHGYSYPYVSALYNDGTRTYNKDTDGKELELGGCQADIRNKDYATKAKIRYIKGKYLKVELNTGGIDSWTTCIQVNDVSAHPVGFISFTAETGGLSDNHDIISVSTNQILKDDTNNSHVNPEQVHHFSDSFLSTSSQKGPSYFFITMIIVLLGVLVYFGAKQLGYGNGTNRDFKHF